MGSAIFRGVAQETDSGPHLKLDFPNKLLTVTDEQASPQVRLKLGRFSASDSDYGAVVYGDNGLPVFDARGSVLGRTSVEFQGANAAGDAWAGFRLRQTAVSAIAGGLWRTVVDGSGDLRVQMNTADEEDFGSYKEACNVSHSGGMSVNLAGGSAGAPSLAFTGDPDNGLYYIGADHWGLSAAGTPIADMTATLFHVTGYGQFDDAVTFKDTSSPGTPVSGYGALYSAGGAGHWISSGGTDTAFGPAGPHCSRCGYDFWRIAVRNERWDAHLYECGMCGAVYRKGPASVLEQLTPAERAELLTP